MFNMTKNIVSPNNLTSLTAERIQDQAILFLDKVTRALVNADIRIKPHWDIDHLCYRTKSFEKYLQLKSNFQEFATLLIESNVNGRPICTFKLHKPISYNDWQIDLVELPAPKPNKVTPEGFEHLEIVCDEPFDELISTFSINPKIKIDPSGLKKTYNQELEVCIDGLNLKFHHCSLESVVTLESNKLIWNAIQQSQVLEIFRNFNPLIAGTFPLGINNSDSDVDIVVELNNRESFLQLCHHHLINHNQYQLKEFTAIDALPTILVTFEFQNVPFEIFAQTRPTTRQKAYLHFLLEERLLKLGGLRFRKLVQNYRNSGLKTEPAFAKALNIVDEPYEALLNLQKKSTSQLKKLLEKV
jgi:predicted metalloenzyme YecM